MKPNHPTLAALIRLHAELGGKIFENRKEAKRLAGDMLHLEAVIRMFSPGFNFKAALQTRDAVTSRPGRAQGRHRPANVAGDRVGDAGSEGRRGTVHEAGARSVRRGAIQHAELPGRVGGTRRRRHADAVEIDLMLLNGNCWPKSRD